MRRSENEERRKLEEESGGGVRTWEGGKEEGGNKSEMGERGETMARSGRGGGWTEGREEG